MEVSLSLKYSVWISHMEFNKSEFRLITFYLLLLQNSASTLLSVSDSSLRVCCSFSLQKVNHLLYSLMTTDTKECLSGDCHSGRPVCVHESVHQGFVHVHESTQTHFPTPRDMAASARPGPSCSSWPAVCGGRCGSFTLWAGAWSREETLCSVECGEDTGRGSAPSSTRFICQAFIKAEACRRSGWW